MPLQHNKFQTLCCCCWEIDVLLAALYTMSALSCLVWQQRLQAAWIEQL
jgi:hypothetical protein